MTTWPTDRPSDRPGDRPSHRLSAVERCYDQIPRPYAEVAEVGPFTLFVARPETGWSLYARPRLGVVDVRPDDVRRLLDRQRELGVPRAIEWVHEVTPALVAAVGVACPEGHLEQVPLLAGGVDAVPPPSVDRTRRLSADDPDLSLTVATVEAGFHDTDVVERTGAGGRRILIERGDLVVVAGYDAESRLVGGGSAAPRGRSAELMGIATVPAARGRGVAGEVTRALTTAVAAAGVELVFLTAASDAAAGVYRRAGLTRIGTGMILAAD